MLNKSCHTTIFLDKCYFDEEKQLSSFIIHSLPVLPKVLLNLIILITVHRTSTLKFLVLSYVIYFTIITNAIIFYKKAILLVVVLLATFRVSVTVLSYLKIFLMLKRHLQKLQPYQIHRGTVNLETYRRSVTIQQL